MRAPVCIIEDVRVHPEADRLTIVRVNGHDVVANLDEDGNPRWRKGGYCAYIPENAIVPEDVLKQRGYWDHEKNKGLLGASKGNRVKMQRFAGFESRGLLFGIEAMATDVMVSFKSPDGLLSDPFAVNEDTSEFFGLTEYVPAE